MRNTLAFALIAAVLTLAGCGQEPAGLPVEAAAFGGHHYQVFEMEMSWHGARDYCRDLGGHLATIGSEQEQRFIAQLADGRYLYLGATDEDEEGTWVWIDGTAFDYTSWFGGQPNNWSDEDYLATYDDGDWVDVHAEGEGFWMPIGFICEWDR